MLSIFQCLFLLEVMQGFLKLPGCSHWNENFSGCDHLLISKGNIILRSTNTLSWGAAFTKVQYLCQRESHLFLQTSGTQVSTKSNCLGGTFFKLDSSMRTTDPIIPKPFRKCYLTLLSSGIHCWDIQTVVKCQLIRSADCHGNVSTLHHQCFQFSGPFRPLGVVILNHC